MIYRYLRFSTDHQDEIQQANTIDNYLSSKKMYADATYTDEGISGGISYKKRKLFDLCNELQPNDIIVVSEISRLTRSGIGELSEIIEQYFKPNKLRLIICNVGLDVDCSDMNPMMEMQLMMMATFAKIEKQLICDRTRSALEARKKKIAQDGYFISKNGNKVTKLGSNREVSDHAIEMASKARIEKAQSNPNNAFFIRYMLTWEERNGKLEQPYTASKLQSIVDELNKLGQTTSTGMEYNVQRLRSMLNKRNNWVLMN